VQQEEVRPSQMGRETLVSRSPIGVVAAIVPWKVPVALALSKIGPALATGCTMVIKPSPGTVLDSYIMAEAAAEAGLPACSTGSRPTARLAPIWYRIRASTR
jgi:geranial dehydrogenase